MYLEITMLRFHKILVALPIAFLFMLKPALAQTTEKPDLSKQPTLYVVGYAHLDTEWRWEYPQVIDEYIRKTMEDNFKLFEKYPHYTFNFSGANRYRFMKEYFPADFAKVKSYVDQGRWYPAGSSMEEGDVNAPSAEAIIRQILYGNNWFRKEFGKASAEYMLPDCFGFPASMPTILAHSGVKGFSTQKLVWGSSADGGGRQSLEKTPEGTPFNVGVWVGPDGESVLAGINPGSYSAGIETDLSQPLPPEPPNSPFEDLQKKIGELQRKLQQQEQSRQPFDQKDVQEFFGLRSEQQAIARARRDQEFERYQGDWAARVAHNGKVSGVFTDYHYYGTGDIGGTPDEDYRRNTGRRLRKTTRSHRDQGKRESSSTGRVPEFAAKPSRVAGGESGRWTGPGDLGDRRPDVSRHHARTGSGSAAIHRRDGVDESFRRFADVAGISEALAAQRRVAGRCCGEGIDRRRVAGRAAISSRTS
jgi:alpha-mannosidase